MDKHTLKFSMHLHLKSPPRLNLPSAIIDFQVIYIGHLSLYPYYPSQNPDTTTANVPHYINQFFRQYTSARMFTSKYFLIKPLLQVLPLCYCRLSLYIFVGIFPLNDNTSLCGIISILRSNQMINFFDSTIHLNLPTDNAAQTLLQEHNEV